MILSHICHLAKTSIRLQTSLIRQFSSKPEQNNYGVKFDEEQIRRKMQEIKQKKDSPKKDESKL